MSVVITGANRGIGLEICTQLHARGEEVIAVCRTPSAALTALGIRVEAGVDVTDMASVEALAGRLEGTTVELLVNNAGVLCRGGLDALDEGDIRRQFEVNAMGPLRVTSALRGHLAGGSKVIIITSRMGSIADNDSGGAYGYRMSKAAVNAVGKSLSIDLAGDGVAVALLHPGWVRTEMTRGSGLIDASEAARGLIARMDELTLERTGSFWHQNGTPLPW
ncbi:MAG: SDR family oxidoreductase [Nannocystaceae bacterium]